jgi:hypothetical protein
MESPKMDRENAKQETSPPRVSPPARISVPAGLVSRRHRNV